MSRFKRALAVLDRVPDPKTVALICGLGLALRLLVSAVSHGSNDIDTWQRFARSVLRYGVLRTYELEPKFNHPPLMGYYAAFADRCATVLGLGFDVTFKLLPIIASSATVFMVQRLARLKLGSLLLFALNPTDVLISAYHGNTDSICAACCVAAVLFADRERPFFSGLFLGAAMNVKLIPTVLIVPLALSLPPRKMWRFGLPLALSALPFVPVLLGPWQAFQSNAISYNSQLARWGVSLLLTTMDGRLQPWSSGMQAFALALGKPVIFGSSVLLGLVELRAR
ncbi:MAG TPA: glycosyltransferase family 87 protein, partial [Polyangiaceae bacterium]|nr:glycosyltransferase family 87 protein [Polyangiaceae bacterium]